MVLRGAYVPPLYNARNPRASPIVVEKSAIASGGGVKTRRKTRSLRVTRFEALTAVLATKEVVNNALGSHGWNLSRFLEVLGQRPHLAELQSMFNQMVQRLGKVVPGLGKDTAGDATALNARRRRKGAKRQAAAAAAAKAKDAAAGTPPNQAGTAKTTASPAATPPAEKIEYDRQGLPQPSGGRKEYTDEQGRVVEVVEWYGYKLHLLVCVKHEVSVAYRISSTKAGDNEVLPELVDQARANLPKDRIQTLAYDKAADDGKVHEKLHAHGIKPLIQNRDLWKDEKERLLPGHDGNTNIAYDEAGTVYCYDRTSQPMIRRPMAYIGHEAARGTLKYRCPARHSGFPCAMSRICNEGKRYGMTIRVKQEIDLRRFPPIPRATKLFERLYKGRTAVERVNGRIKIFWGADDGNVTGPTRFHALLATLMVVHLAFATLLASTPRREGTLGKLRLSPIAKALHERMTDGPARPSGRKRKAAKRSHRQTRLFAA
jgi:Transposase DDE domain